MQKSLRILVADDERDMRDYLTETLPNLGHQVVGAASSGKELLQLAEGTHPDLVITDIKMPDLDGLQAAERLNATQPTPVIVITAYDQPELLARAGAGPVLSYLMKPIRESDLRPAITVAMRRFEQVQQLCKDNADLRRDLEARKLIERAKGVLMHRLRVEEPKAYTLLRKRASDLNRKLADVAQEVLHAEAVFAAFE